MTATRRHRHERSRLSLYHEDQAESRRREERRKIRRRSQARLSGALLAFAALTALSMLRLGPGTIRHVVYTTGRRALACVVGTVTVPESFYGYWETHYDPIIDYEEDPRPPLDPPPTDIGYVVPVPNCPETFAEGQIDPGRAFFDSMLTLTLNVNQAHETGGNLYTHTFYAIVHPDGVTCQGPDGTDYDRVQVLEDLGFWVKIWGENVNTTAVEDPEVEDAIAYGELNSLIALNAFAMDDHDLIAIIDPTTQMLGSPNDIYTQLLADPTKEVLLSPQPPTPGSPTPLPGTPEPVNTGFLVIKPNQTTFDAIQQDIQQSTYNPITGWNDTGITELSLGGVLSLHYGDSDAVTTLDPCSYGDAINDPGCSENFTEMKVATLGSTCGEPWNCAYDNNTMPDICRDAIEEWHATRSEFEDGCLNSPVSVSNGTYEPEIYHGHCSGPGFEGYQKMLPDNGVCIGEMQTLTDLQVIPGADQTQRFSMRTQTFTGNGNTCVEGTVTIPTYVPPFNIAIVIDVSGSTSGNFGGTSIGDVNGDGYADKILDAEIASIIAMIESVAASSNLNNENVDIGLIKFSQTASYLGHFPPSDPNDESAINPDIYNKLVALRHGGITNFDDALDKVVEYFENDAPHSGGSNLLFFLSDGVPNTCGDDDNESCSSPNGHVSNNHANVLNYNSELAALSAMEVHREAIGVGSGSDIAVNNGLWMIDSDNDPQKVTSTDALVDVLTANPVQGTVVDFSLTKNGVAVPGYDKDSILSGPTGFSYGPVTLDGLDKTWGEINTVQASLTMELEGEQATFNTLATITGTVTNLAMSRRRLTAEAKSSTEMCQVYKRYRE